MLLHMSKLQSRLVATLETNNRTALELLKLSSAISNLARAHVGNPNYDSATLFRCASFADTLSAKISSDNQKTIELLEQFP